MSNFKNLKELYQALIDGKTIEHFSKESLVKVSDENQDVLVIKYKGKDQWVKTNWDFQNPANWSIYQEPEKWFKVTRFKKDTERPYMQDHLFRDEADFLEFTRSDKEDYHWIKLEEVKL